MNDLELLAIFLLGASWQVQALAGGMALSTVAGGVMGGIALVSDVRAAIRRRLA